MTDADSTHPPLVHRLPWWAWAITGAGFVVLAVSWSRWGAVAVVPNVAVALCLAVPLVLAQRSIELQLSEVQQAVTTSIEAAEQMRLSGEPAPLLPEGLDLWPMQAVADAPASGVVGLRLYSPGSVAASTQPIDVMVVVTDPAGRTFCAERRPQTPVTRDVAAWTWPSDFTSGDDIPAGRHLVRFFVCPIEVGPARRFGLADTTEFEFSPRG